MAGIPQRQSSKGEPHGPAKTEMPEKDAPIHLVAHDAEWPQLFREESAALQRVLKPWLTGPIEHIGSTAVPDMVAKPVIDIMAAVGSLEESKDAIVAVQGLGYLYAPYRTDVMHWFCKPRFSFRTHHLHLVPYRSELWMARIAFRDRLREDAEVAAEYSDLKRKLAVSFEHDREAYTDAKSGFIARIIAESQRK
jgi:GrpB-like predicted nucleotidyltransferase (UPF0157 family)